MELTKEQIELLKGFVLDIMEPYLDEWGDLDGFQLQEIAEKNKILVPQTVYEPCGEGCNCAEYYSQEEWQKGVKCYRMPAWLTRDAQPQLERIPDTQNGDEEQAIDEIMALGGSRPNWPD